MDHPSDKALYTFSITAPGHYQTAATGARIEQTDIDLSRRRTIYQSKAPVAAKVAALAIGRFAVQYIDDLSGILIENLVYPQDRDAGFSAFAYADTAVHLFQKHIAPFPWAKLANIQSRTRWGGLEGAGAILYNERAIGAGRDIEGLIAHEIVHQWYGNAVTETDWHHIWLSEGFATYLTHFYFENRKGRPVYLERLQNDRKRIIQFAAQNPDAIVVDSKIRDPNNQLNAYTYQKGSWILHMLRHDLGDELFFECLRTFYSDYAHQNASTEDFIKAINDRTGKNLHSFFYQWLYTPQHPVLQGTWKWDSRNKQVIIELSQIQDHVFDFSLEIGFQIDREMRVETIKMYQETERYAFRLKSKPKNVILDPFVKLLFEGELSGL